MDGCPGGLRCIWITRGMLYGHWKLPASFRLFNLFLVFFSFPLVPGKAAAPLEGGVRGGGSMGGSKINSLIMWPSD